MKTEFGVEGARTWKEERKVKLDCSAKFLLKVLGKSLGPGGDFSQMPLVSEVQWQREGLQLGAFRTVDPRGGTI